MDEELKQRLRAVGFGDFDGMTAAADGVTAENENPDDAAVENNGIWVAVSWPCICHAQLGSPCEEPNAILFCVAFSCQNIKN